MSKINLKTSLVVIGTEKEHYEYNLEGIKKDNSLLYKEKDTSVVLNIFEDYLELKRKNEEYVIVMRFSLNESTCNYLVNNLGELQLDIKTQELNISDKEIKIVYNMNDNVYTYIVKYEVKE